MALEPNKLKNREQAMLAERVVTYCRFRAKTNDDDAAGADTLLYFYENPKSTVPIAAIFQMKKKEALRRRLIQGARDEGGR